MMAAEKQMNRHKLISNNHTESTMTTISHGPYYAIHVYIAWQPLNKLCWEKIGEKIRGSTPIGFCVIAGPFSLSDNALWQVQLLLQSGCLGLLLATELLNHKRELHQHPLNCIKYIHIMFDTRYRHLYLTTEAMNCFVEHENVSLWKTINRLMTRRHKEPWHQLPWRRPNYRWYSGLSTI